MIFLNSNFIKKNKIYFISFLFMVALNLIYLLLNSFSLNGQGILGFKEIYDNVHYITISNFGYIEDKLYAFFPFVPIMIHLIGINGMLVLNHIISFLNMFFLIYLLKDIYIKQDNETLYIVILFLCSPVQIFAYTLYTEPLFILFSLLTSILYKKKKNGFVIGVIVGFSLLIRSFGFALFLTIIFCLSLDYFIKYKNEKQMKKKVLKDLFAFILSSCAIGSLYPIFLYFKSGSMFTFVSIQKSYWCRISTNMIENIILGFKNTFLCEDFWLNSFLTKFILSIEFLFWIMLCIFTIYKLVVFFKTREYELFEVLNFLFTMLIISGSIRNTENPYCSYYRYYLGCYSFYILFSNSWNSKKQLVRYLFPSIMFLIHVVIFIYYFNSYYFY